MYFNSYESPNKPILKWTFLQVKQKQQLFSRNLLNYGKTPIGIIHNYFKGPHPTSVLKKEWNTIIFRCSNDFKSM